MTAAPQRGYMGTVGSPLHRTAKLDRHPVACGPLITRFLCRPWFWSAELTCWLENLCWSSIWCCPSVHSHQKSLIRPLSVNPKSPVEGCTGCRDFFWFAYATHNWINLSFRSFWRFFGNTVTVAAQVFTYVKVFILIDDLGILHGRGRKTLL